MIRKKDGTTTSESTVETMMPPITAIAIGARKVPAFADAERPRAACRPTWRSTS